MKTAQRVSATDASDGFVLARSVLAYREAARIIGNFIDGAMGAAGEGREARSAAACDRVGAAAIIDAERPRVLEIGTGTGYGVEILAPVCGELVTVDKFLSAAATEFEAIHSASSEAVAPPRGGVDVGAIAPRQSASVVSEERAAACEDSGEPRGGASGLSTPKESSARPGDGWRAEKSSSDPQILKSSNSNTLNSQLGNVSFRRMTVPPLDFPDGSFDFVVTFQVVEHIRRDDGFLAEIRRVLRPGGRLVITTPNREMSLTRNPWHVREYSAHEFEALVGKYFAQVEARGVVGDERVAEYFERNREGVRRWTRWDVLRLREWLPRWMLRVPYDVANRLNRRRLLVENLDLTRAIGPENYRLVPVDDTVFDLFYVATKKG